MEAREEKVKEKDEKLEENESTMEAMVEEMDINEERMEAEQEEIEAEPEKVEAIVGRGEQMEENNNQDEQKDEEMQDTDSRSESSVSASDDNEQLLSGHADELDLEKPLSEEEIEELISHLLGVESKAAEAQEALEKESLSKVESEVREELAQTLHGDEIEVRPLTPFPWEILKTLTVDELWTGGKFQIPLDQIWDTMLRHEPRDVMSLTNLLIGSIKIQVKDLDTNTLHSVTLWKYPHEDTFAMRESWVEEFVKRRKLVAGMVVGMYWDSKANLLCFSVLE